MVSFIPKISPSEEEEMAAGEFIFVLDRSYSMSSNDRIDIAKKALVLFLQSLPERAIFNVISFGTDHKFMFNESQVYSDESLSRAKQKLKGFGADLGGTNMEGPLRDLFKTAVKVTHPRNVFLLTDGAINSPKEVVSLIKKYNNNTRVHTFGIGSGASTYLVKETAKAGLGGSYFVQDNDSTLNAKVIQALRKSCAPAFSGIEVDWGTEVILQSPSTENMDNVFEGESFCVQAILKKSALENSEGVVNIKLTNTLTGQEVVQEVQIGKTGELSKSGFAFSLTAKSAIDNASRAANFDKQKIVDLSTKYSVLSKETAIFGQVKNKNKPTEEMELVQIPVNNFGPQS